MIEDGVVSPIVMSKAQRIPTMQGEKDVEDLVEDEHKEAITKLEYLARKAMGGGRVEVFDDWMAPTLRRGDFAHLDNTRQVHCEGVYAFQYKGEPHIKRISVLSSKKLVLSVEERKGTEELYPQEFNGFRSVVVDRDEVEIIGRVVFGLRKL